MALVNENSVMALYDNSVKALMQIWLQCDGTNENTCENNSVMALINKMSLYDNSVKALMQMWVQCDGTGKMKIVWWHYMITVWRHCCKCDNSVMALIVNTYENDSVMALINKNSVMALYDNSVKALMRM